MTVLDRSTENGDRVRRLSTGTTAKPDKPVAPSSRNRCPECNQVFKKVHPRQLFCCSEHKRAFHNRATVRGATLVPMAMACRMTRDGSRGAKGTGKAARREHRRLLDKWIAEDREAGRMSMVDYMQERWRIGY